MTTATSSAEPLLLIGYSSRTTSMDAMLRSEASRLSGMLSAFQSSCREYRVDVGSIPARISCHSQDAEARDLWVRTIAVGFIRADAEECGPWLRRMIEEGRSWYEHFQGFWDVLKRFAGTAAVIVFMRPGARAGEIIIDLPDGLRKVVKLREVRKWAGVSPHLNNIKWANLWKHTAKIGLITAGVVIISKWTKDIATYTGTELASAMTVDAAFVLASTGAAILATAGVTWLLAAAAPALAPVVAAALILVTCVVIGFAVDQALENYRDKAIASVDDNVFKPLADKIAKGMDAVGSAVDHAAEQFEETVWRNLKDTWNFCFGTDETSRQVQSKFWLDAGNYSRQHDLEIRATAATISLVPIVGDLYATDYLMAFGKMECDEFVIRQGFNATAAAVNIPTLGAYDAELGTAASAAQDLTLYKTGRMSEWDLKVNQAFNIGGYGLGAAGEGMAKHIMPMEYAIPKDFSPKWFIGKSINYRRLRSVIGDLPQIPIIYADGLRESDVVQSRLKEWGVTSDLARSESSSVTKPK